MEPNSYTHCCIDSNNEHLSSYVNCPRRHATKGVAGEDVAINEGHFPERAETMDLAEAIINA